MKAKEFLLSLSKCNIDIKKLENEIAIWQSFGEEEELRMSEKQLADKKEERHNTLHQIIKSLKKLPPIEYDILFMRFIGVNDGSGELKTMTLQEIADHYKKEYNWATTTQGRALEHLQQIIDRGEIHA